MATEEPLSKEGRDLKVKCKSMAFYEVRYRLRTHEKEAPKAALVQFLDADGRPITEEHVCPGFSEEVGRYSYLKANPETGVGVARFFAPASGGRLTLRFRAWANRHPVFLGRDISVRQIASWTIAAEPGNSEPVRLISVARPLSVPVPAKSKVRLSVALRAEADGASIVLHAPCTMTMEGGRLKLGEASGESGSLRPFAGKGMQAALVVENAGQTPVVISLACEGAVAIDLAEVVVADMAAADDTTGEGQPAPAGSPSGALSAPARSHGEKVRWTTKVGNRLFLRSTIIDTKQELMLAGEKLSRMEHALEESLLLVEKKVDYLLAKIDAYAEVDDKNGAALHNGLATVRKMAQDLGETADANQAELRNWQGAVDSRLADIEQGNAHLAGEITAVGKKGHELAETVKAGQDATDERLKAVQQAERELREVVTAGQETTDARLGAIARANADLTRDLAFVRDAGRKLGEAVDANQKELLSRQDGLEGRLAAIEKSGAKLAAVLDASDSHVKQALKDIGGRTKKLEDMDKRLAKLAERLARIETTRADTVTNIEKSVKAAVADINKNAEKTAFNEFRQHVALDTLQQLLKFDLPLPATRGWAASPDFLLHLYQHIITHRPKTVVELGSGVSTVVAAAALAANGDGGRLHSLDHEEAYAEATSKLVAQHGFPNVATVYHAPLAPWKPARPTELGEEWQWYAVPRAVKSLKVIDLLVVDGPPEATGRSARYPAVPHFRTRLAPGCTVLLDDARRPDEKATAEIWSRDDGLSLKLLLRADREFEKGLAILTNNC